MKRIMVIDDDPGIASFLERLLNRMGHEVAVAGDGQKGERAFRDAPADIVVLDIFMPEQDGLETMARLREIDPKVKIIAISGGDRTGHVDLLNVAGSMGADELLKKPFDDRDILDAIERVSGLEVAGC